MTISPSTTAAVALFLRCPMGAASVNGDDLEQKPVGVWVMRVRVVVVVVVVDAGKDDKGLPACSSVEKFAKNMWNKNVVGACRLEL